MANYQTWESFCTEGVGAGNDQPANILLQTDRSKINVNIHTISGSVSVGNKNTVTFHHNHENDDTTSSDSDSDDSDTDNFCRKFNIPDPRSVRGNMKNMKPPRESTLIIGPGSEPVVLDRWGRPVNARTTQGNGSRTSGQARTSSARSTTQATPSASRGTPQTTAGGRPTAQPSQSGRGQVPTPTGSGSRPGRTMTEVYQTSQGRPSSGGYTFTQTYRQTVVETANPNTFGSCRTALEDKNIQVDKELRRLPQPNRLVDETIIRTIAPHFGKGWRRVFRFLSMSDDNIDIAFQEQMPGNGIVELIHSLLLNWIRECERPCVRVLAEALMRADQQHIIPHLKSAMVLSITQ